MNRIKLDAPEYIRFKAAKERFSVKSAEIQAAGRAYKRLSNPTNRQWLEYAKKKEEYSKECKLYQDEQRLFNRWVRSLYGAKTKIITEDWLDKPLGEELEWNFDSPENQAADNALEMVKIHINYEKKLAEEKKELEGAVSNEALESIKKAMETIKQKKDGLEEC